MSTTQHESKRRVKAGVLSLEVSPAQEPKRSRVRSKTVLKSPHKTVGIEGSTASAMPLKKRSRAGLRLGAYKQSTRNETSYKENSHNKERPGTSHQELTSRRTDRKRIMSRRNDGYQEKEQN